MIRPYKLKDEDNVEALTNSEDVSWNGHDTFKNNLRRHLRIEQKMCCAYCRMPILFDHKSSRHIEHIIPKDLNTKFMFEPRNLVIACSQCNSTKKDKEVFGPTSKDLNHYPINSDDFIIFHPIYDKYDNFFIIEDNMLILPKNERAKKTIEICGLDRVELIIERYQYCSFFQEGTRNSNMLASILKAKNIDEINVLVESLEKNITELIFHDEIKSRICS